ncbi:MAG: hypothetical protein WC443_00230 [Desulfobaccales bacterium]
METSPSSQYEHIGHFLHDLSQPLAAVTGLVDLLLLELDERDRIFKEVQLISQQLEEVLRIIGEIRRIAREAAEQERKSLQPLQPGLS